MPDAAAFAAPLGPVAVSRQTEQTGSRSALRPGNSTDLPDPAALLPRAGPQYPRSTTSRTSRGTKHRNSTTQIEPSAFRCRTAIAAPATRSLSLANDDSWRRPLAYPSSLTCKARSRVDRWKSAGSAPRSQKQTARRAERPSPDAAASWAEDSFPSTKPEPQCLRSSTQAAQRDTWNQAEHSNRRP